MNRHDEDYLRKYNNGDYNVGYSNNGNVNFGDNNKGDYNEGNSNVGDKNIGNHNKGNGNLGHRNKGNYNIGKHNAGDDNIGYRNKGKCNIGIVNKGDYICGIACTKKTPLYLFNKPSKHTLEELNESGALSDIIEHVLTDKVKELDTFDMDVWNELGEEEE